MKFIIIEKSENLDQFIQDNPQCSFLPHMGVFRPGKETTKCRVVFLSNLAQKDTKGQAFLSHNQTMLPGASINRKISTALMQLRFDNNMGYL